jgi:hypothetical protein
MPRPIISKHKLPTTLKPPNRRQPNLSNYLRIYRKSASNLHLREDVLHRFESDYEVGPSIIWTEDAADLSIFTTAENYTNFIGFEAPFSNPKSPRFLPKLLQKMRMKKGTILIKEATQGDAMHIPVHFCAYRVDAAGELTIFDPSWHGADPGIYSTTAFYDSLDAFGIPYKHAEQERKHHWQSLLPNDVFCQTWSLQWLLQDSVRRFPLPKTRLEAATHLTTYIKQISRSICSDVERFGAVFPAYKLEGNDAGAVFRHILGDRILAKNIYELF